MNEKVDKLNQRSDKFTIVLNDNELKLLKNSRYILNKIQSTEMPYTFIAIIYHSLDKREDDSNSYKTPHYHMVITFDGRYRVHTILLWLSDLFKINENQIQIDKCSNVAMQTRYLIHLDDPDKTQYDIWDIATNDTNVLNRHIKLKFVHDLKELIIFVKQNHYDLEEIMTNLGNYDANRKYINDLLINYYRKR